MSRTMNGKSSSQTKSTTAPPAFSLSQPGILQRKCDCGGVAGLTGQCQECSGNRLSGQGQVSKPPSAGDEVTQMNAMTATQQLPGHSFGRMSVQAKLAIGAPGDKYEQEADRVASQVVQQINAPASAPSTQGQSVQRQEDPDKELQAKSSISDLQRSPLKPEDKEDEEKIQPKSILQRREAIAGGEASKDLTSAINRVRGGGQPLEAGLQQSMGQAMGADFTGVKVHTDAQSDQLNKSIQAKAFTTGQDVFFRQGAYEPLTREGQELIAHELVHVVQQQPGMIQRSVKADVSTVKFDIGNTWQSMDTAVNDINNAVGASVRNIDGDWAGDFHSQRLMGRNVTRGNETSLASLVAKLKAVKAQLKGHEFEITKGNHYLTEGPAANMNNPYPTKRRRVLFGNDANGIGGDIRIVDLSTPTAQGQQRGHNRDTTYQFKSVSGDTPDAVYTAADKALRQLSSNKPQENPAATDKRKAVIKIHSALNPFPYPQNKTIPDSLQNIEAQFQARLTGRQEFYSHTANVDSITFTYSHPLAVIGQQPVDKWVYLWNNNNNAWNRIKP